MTEDTGYQTLEIIAKADKFNRWMYETIRPFCRPDILEIGSGIGNISQFFIRDGYPITLSDTDELYYSRLKQKFQPINVLTIDLVHEDFDQQYGTLFETFDTVIFLNVLEHIRDDGLALENCRHFLKPGGTLVILVPAYSFLFSKMDRELHHYRRYSSKKIAALVTKNKFTVRRAFHFNALGIAAWLFGKMLRFDSIPGKNMKLFNDLVPLAKRIDKILFRKVGLSVIVVAHKDL